MAQENSSGPLRKVFTRGSGVWQYISPGLFVTVPLSLFYWGLLGIFPIVIGGFVQDWANNEPSFSWVKRIIAQ